MALTKRASSKVRMIPHLDIVGDIIGQHAQNTVISTSRRQS
jgi:hypothetical protein